MDQTLETRRLRVHCSQGKVLKLLQLPNDVQELFKENAGWNKLVSVLSD